MISSLRSAVLATAAAVALAATTVTATEELRVVSPQSLAQQFNYNGQMGVIRETPALFGIPSYQTAVYGPLYYSVPNNGCSYINATAMHVSGGTNILLVDRGGCTFTTKIRNAGNSGFQSVIVGDNNPESNIPYMGDDGTTPAVTTPSVMISQADAQTLKTKLNVGELVTVSITYSLPSPDNRVEWTLWTTSVDPLSAQFKHTFAKSVEVLGNSSLFTPQMYIINGQGIGCTAAGSQCGNQCSNGGRYCAMDPERNITDGLSGRDVIQENVRQLCLYQALNITNSPQYLWFDYVAAFDLQCSQPCPNWGPVDPFSPADPECNNGFSQQCSYSVMDKLNLPLRFVQQCVKDSNGYNATDSNNKVLDAQLAALATSPIYFIPTLTINLQPYRGSLLCSKPTDLTNCGPLSAICAGFIQGSLPQACQTTPGCDVGQVRDVCEVCGGDGQIDACGDCKSVASASFNVSCKGCDGVPNSGLKYDSCGICNGPGQNMGSCLSSGAIAAIFIVCIGAAIAVAVGVWFYLRRQSRAMREDIDVLLKQYLPLEGGTNKGASHTSDHQSLVEDANDI